MSAAAVELRELRRSYGERRALDGVTLDVRERELFGLLGPNGGGKTTLFRVISTLLPPSAGTARVLGHALPEDAALVRRGIGVVFQSPSLDVHLTVRENLTHQGHLYGVRGAVLAERIDGALHQLGLADRRDDLVRDLSGGLKRRVELAKSLLHEPSLLLLDEPTTGLDPAARRDVWEHLSRLRDERGVASLVTTHLMEEAERCDRVAILDHGRLVALGAPQELRASIGGDVVAVVPRAAEALNGLRDRMAAQLRVDVQSVGGVLRVETREGAALVARVLELFDADVASVSVGHPTLEDVFLAKTGHAFE